MTEAQNLLEVIQLVDLKLKLEAEAEEYHFKKWGESQNLQSYAIDALNGCEASGKRTALIWCRMMLQQQVIKIQEANNENEDDE